MIPSWEPKSGKLAALQGPLACLGMWIYRQEGFGQSKGSAYSLLATTQRTQEPQSVAY